MIDFRPREIRCTVIRWHFGKYTNTIQMLRPMFPETNKTNPRSNSLYSTFEGELLARLIDLLSMPKFVTIEQVLGASKQNKALLCEQSVHERSKSLLACTLTLPPEHENHFVIPNSLAIV